MPLGVHGVPVVGPVAVVVQEPDPLTPVGGGVEPVAVLGGVDRATVAEKVLEDPPLLFIDRRRDHLSVQVEPVVVHVLQTGQPPLLVRSLSPDSSTDDTTTHATQVTRATL